ncbi:MAG: metallophosphoesterase family protein, partial [Candidatus Binataceae bacterium]
AEKYADYFLAHGGQIPYRRYSQLTDFIIDNRLPANARVGIVGDWGTGRPEALAVLKQLAGTHPDIAVHLGDIYYSGTEYEVDTYFYQEWKSALGDLAAGGKTFALSGNHEMFCGGAPYYRLIDRLGQPASYFCLRNEHWQIIGIDTGLHDHDPLRGKPTYLEDSEAAWLRHKLDNAGGRRTILLSHHQLFTSKEDIGGQAINQKLYQQLQSCLPEVDLWLWGHEHDLVIYKNYLRVLGRCVGHGAFPVALDELPSEPRFPNVPTEPVTLGNDGLIYSHGYATIVLDGPSATIRYWQDSTPATPLFEEKI